MLKCAIEGCDPQEKFLRSGALHLLDVVLDDATVVKKMVWLCAICSKRYTVQTWRKPGEQICLRKPAHMFILEEVFPIESTASALRGESVSDIPSHRKLRHAG